MSIVALISCFTRRPNRRPRFVDLIVVIMSLNTDTVANIAAIPGRIVAECFIANTATRDRRPMSVRIGEMLIARSLARIAAIMISVNLISLIVLNTFTTNQIELNSAAIPTLASTISLILSLSPSFPSFGIRFL